MRWMVLGKMRLFKKDRIKVHQYPKLVFTYPLILAGFFLYLADGLMPPALAGWIYLSVVAMNLIVLGLDIDLSKSILLGVTSTAGFLGGLYAEAKGYSINPAIGAVFSLIRTFDIKFGLALSLLMSMVYIAMLALVWVDSWTIDPFNIRRTHFGRTTHVMPRDNVSISVDYPDVLEVLLLGAGDVVLYRADREIARIRNVPLLILKKLVIEEKDEKGEK